MFALSYLPVAISEPIPRLSHLLNTFQFAGSTQSGGGNPEPAAKAKAKAKGKAKAKAMVSEAVPKTPEGIKADLSHDLTFF